MSDVTELKKELKRTLTDLDHANETIRLLSMDSLNVSKLDNNIVGKMSQLEKQCKALTLERSKYQSKCSALQTENKNLLLGIYKNSDDSVGNESTKVLVSELDRVNKYCKTLISERSKFQSLADTYRIENERLLKSVSSKKSGNLIKLTNSNESLQEQVRSLEKENETLKKACSESDGGVSELNLTIDRLQAENDRLREENEKLKPNNVKLNLEIRSMHSENELLKLENEELRAQVNSFGNKASNIDVETLENVNYLVTQLRKNY